MTIVVGKLFGGALKGLVPLAMCLSSGVWLWMKEVIRSGREVEWESEKSRGQMVSMLEDLIYYYTDISRLQQICYPSRSSG